MQINNLTERQSFDTHFNYIRCLSTLMSGAELRYKRKCNPSSIPSVNMKENIIKLTAKSLKDEYEIVQIDNNYSYASTSWLPVKSYYLIFNLLLTIDYLLKLQENVFQLTHSACVEEFTRKLKKGELEFSEKILNQVFDRTIINYREQVGANLSTNVDLNRMFKMSMRKVANYKLEEWKRKNKINLRTHAGRVEIENYLNKFSISIFEFPYMMRIRANYRDFAFIDGIEPIETAQYFNKYYLFTKEFTLALMKVKKSLESFRTKNKRLNTF